MRAADNNQRHAEFVASIRAHGLLENLVVTPRTKTLFGVSPPGAHRLCALNTLATDKHIPKNHPAPCLVVDKTPRRSPRSPRTPCASPCTRPTR